MAEEMNETERYYCEAINDPYKCMETVKKAPWSIRYAKEQTLELCMEAVQNDGEVLAYVKEQTPEICMAAVQENFRAIRFVKEQIPEVCMAAVNESAKALQYIEHQTPEMFIAAMKHDSRAVNYISEEFAKSLINNVEKRISNRQAVKPEEYYAYQNLTAELEQINSEVDMNEDFEM